jgi:hypothetical protein
VVELVELNVTGMDGILVLRIKCYETSVCSDFDGVVEDATCIVNF